MATTTRQITKTITRPSAIMASAPEESVPVAGLALSERDMARVRADCRELPLRGDACLFAMDMSGLCGTR